jgi:hypothetical protein
MISLTAVRNWLTRNDALRDRVTEECMTGKKKICLAVTEGNHYPKLLDQLTEISIRRI